MSTRALAEALVREVDIQDGNPARTTVSDVLRIALEMRIREFLRQGLQLTDQNMALLAEEQRCATLQQDLRVDAIIQKIVHSRRVGTRCTW